MLKFFYRLRRRRGVVLFAVIAMMTILITMATVAYFTTRTAYQTVVSNYDFSQMYISTTSVSDMVLDSLVGTTSQEGTKTNSGVNSVVTLNYFDDFKDGMKKLVTAGTVGGKFVGVSSNISWANKDSLPAMLAECGSNPLIPGALDGVRVTITLQNKSDKNPDGTSLSAGLTNYYFLCETVGFYRNNTVTVQDYVYQTTGSTTTGGPNTFDTFFTATGQKIISGQQSHDNMKRMVVICTDEITDNAYFQNTFTVFHSGRPNKFLGGIRTTGGLYLDKVTFDIPAPTETERHDWVIGGDLLVSGNTGDMDLNGNDLYVKGDLYFATGNSIMAGNIYVEGNVYILPSGTSTFDITGGDTGVVPEKARSNTNPGLYVNGKIIKADKNTKTGTSSWTSGKNAIIGLSSDSSVDLTNLTIGKEMDLIGAAAGFTFNVSPANQNFKMGSNDIIYQTKGTQANYSDRNDFYDKVTDDQRKEMVWSSLQTKICTQEQDVSNNTYKSVVTDTTVENVLDTSKNGNLKTLDYENYSAKQATVNKVLTLDFSCVKDSEGRTGTEAKVAGGSTLTCNLGTIDGKTATISFKNSGGGENNIGNLEDGAVIDLPYIDGGYRIEFTGLTSSTVWDQSKGQNVTVKTLPVRLGRTTTFNIHTADGYEWKEVIDENGKITYVQDTSKKIESNWTKITMSDGTEMEVVKSMPLVLTPNYNDGSSDPGYGTDNLNAFSWLPGMGGKCQDSSGGVKVQLVSQDNSNISADGGVLMEMANYATSNYTDSESGNSITKDQFVEYDPANYDKIATAKYIPTGMEKVGTLNQVKDSNNPSNIKTASDLSSFIKSGTNEAATGYENKLIFVSNMNLVNTSGIAFSAQKNSTMFGYVYAPNANFYAPKIDAGVPVFGGMIVSDYNIGEASFVYCKPELSLIESLGALSSRNKVGGTKVTVSGDWMRVTGSNYLG